MFTYYVTFRIANDTVNGKTYAERRQTLVDNVRSAGAGFWDETTSFFLIESNLDTNAMGAKATSGLSAAKDMVVVIDPTDQSAAYFGAVQHVDVLQSFFPETHKVSDKRNRRI
jgi:hypothetical protein